MKKLKVITSEALETRDAHRKQNIQNDCTFIWAQMAARLKGRDDLFAGGDGTGNNILKMMTYFKKNGLSLDKIIKDEDVPNLYRSVGAKLLGSEKEAKDYILRFSKGRDCWGYISANINKGDGTYENHAFMWTVMNNEAYFSDGIFGSAASKYFNQLDLSSPVSMFKASELDMDIDQMIKDKILLKK